MTLQITVVDSELHIDDDFPNKETWLLTVSFIRIEDRRFSDFCLHESSEGLARIWARKGIRCVPWNGFTNRYERPSPMQVFLNLRSFFAISYARKDFLLTRNPDTNVSLRLQYNHPHARVEKAHHYFLEKLLRRKWKYSYSGHLMIWIVLMLAYEHKTVRFA